MMCAGRCEPGRIMGNVVCWGYWSGD